MNYDDRDYYHDQQGDYEADLIEEGIAELANNSVQWYLGTYGDAIEARVNFCVTEAEQLLHNGHYGSSLALSITAVEIIIRFFIVRPLVQGAFLSDEWANILVKQIFTNRSSEDRKLMPKVTRMWGLDLQELQLSNGNNLWQTLISDLLLKRNDFVHKAQTVDKNTATYALDCVKVLMKDLVEVIVVKVGLSWPHSDCWCKVIQGVGGAKFSTSYTPRDPFDS